MSDGILFLVLPERNVAKAQALVRELIVPDKRDRVQILSDAGAACLSTDVKGRVTEGLIGRISAYPKRKDNRLIVGHETQCSIADLTEWWHTHCFGERNVRKLSPTAAMREVTEHLERTGRHWRIHAETEIARFDGPQSNLDGWLQQFGELGWTQIGRKIAAKLSVIPTGELPRGAFAMCGPDLIGQSRANCYVQDDDAGGSWLEMQAILTHACPQGSVFPVHWDKEAERMLFPDASVDEFVIHEDGLWSGSEAVRRLRAIHAEPPPAPVAFRFGVVTDFGLMVARQAIRALGLSGRVSIDASASRVIYFLEADIPERLKLGQELAPEDYYSQLHQHVDPYAFNLKEDWTPGEIEICERIGAQLVRRWLSQRASEPPSIEKVERFQLGGGRFASTVVFSRSVPKVCLPLLWLDGPVALGEKQVSWRPLFVDARRVSDDHLLLSRR